MDTFEQIKQDALSAIKICESVSSLQTVKTQYLGPKSQIIGLLKGLKDLSREEKATLGQKVNTVKVELESAIAAKNRELQNQERLSKLGDKIDPSLLTVFRRERISNKDNEEETSTNLMDKLIAKTVEIALEEGIIEAKNKIIQDSTHTNAMYQHISPREELIKQAKELRKSIYKIDETMHDKMPKKREGTGLLED